MSADPDVLPAPGPSVRPAPRPPGFWLRIIGSALLIAAAGIAGYVWWVLYGTGIETAAAQQELRSSFEQQIVDDPTVPAPGTDASRPPPGSAVAQIQIPKIDLDMVVVQGTGIEDLKKGPGHYVETAMPWEDRGRVGIAGHRTTYLHPFQDLDDLDRGDAIRLRTRFGTFDYEVTRVFVIPSEGSGRVLEQTEEPTLVLTTCHPMFSSAERLIVTADRVT
ncbi:MAG: sortase [Actinomycetota bacterium]